MIEITFVRDDLENEVEKTVEVEEGKTVDKFLEEQGVEREEVLVSRNGTIVSGRHRIEQEDVIKVIDVIAGG